MTEYTKHKKTNVVLIIIFVVLIYTPFIVGIFEEDRKVSPVEKRALASFPEFPENAEEANQYPQKLNAYYSDHFGLRDLMTKRYYKLKNSIDKKSGAKDVTVGKEGWLFLGEFTPGYKRFSDPIGDAMHVNLYTDDQLDEFVSYVTTLQKWLKKRGSDYVFTIAPNKHTIYFEYLPDGVKKQNSESATDQLIKTLRARTTIPVVDLRKPLMAAKGKYQLYYKTDTHWKHYAANIAQYEITHCLEKLYPGKIKARLLEDSEFKQGIRPKGDLTGYANMEPVEESSPKPIFKDKIDSREDYEKNDRAFSTVYDKGEINCLMFRDSFSEYLTPYLSRRFKRVTYIWDMLNYKKMTQYFEKAQPNVVIEEWVERHLPFVPEDKELFEADFCK